MVVTEPGWTNWQSQMALKAIARESRAGSNPAPGIELPYSFVQTVFVSR